MGVGTPPAARFALVVIMIVVVVPVIFGGVGLVVMLLGEVVRQDLSDGAIMIISAIPTAYLSVRLYRHSAAPDEPVRYR